MKGEQEFYLKDDIRLDEKYKSCRLYMCRLYMYGAK